MIVVHLLLFAALAGAADIVRLRRDMESHMRLTQIGEVKYTHESALRTLAAVETALDAEAVTPEWFLLDDVRARLRRLCFQQEDNATYAHHLASEYDIVASLATYTNPETTSRVQSELNAVIDGLACPVQACCHPTRSFVIGYGSLMNSASRLRTVPEATFSFPVLVRGYRRAWGRHLPSWTPLGVRATNNIADKLHAMCVEVFDFDEWDSREGGYDRVLVDPAAVALYPSACPTQREFKFYMYMPPAITPPSASSPILLSYVDVIVEGALSIGRDFAVNFFKECEGWGHVVDDREKSREGRYSRNVAVTEATRAFVDKHLEASFAAENIDGEPSSLPFFAFYDAFLVKQEQYEVLFKEMVTEVVAVYAIHFKEVVGPLRVRVVRDISSTAEAWYQDGEIVVNIARPVTQEKLQQLVAHEVMHHVQALASSRRTTSVSALFAEGGAEFAVDLVFPPGGPRAAHLERFFGASPADAATLVSVSATRSALSWRHVVRIASAMYEGRMDDATGNAQMESHALLRQDSWPSVGFMRQWGFGYVATYAIGKEVIGEFVKAAMRCLPHATAWDVFVAFTRCTPTPRTAQRYAAKCEWVSAWFRSC